MVFFFCVCRCVCVHEFRSLRRQEGIIRVLDLGLVVVSLLVWVLCKSSVLSSPLR